MTDISISEFSLSCCNSSEGAGGAIKRISNIAGEGASTKGISALAGDSTKGVLVIAGEGATKRTFEKAGMDGMDGTAIGSRGKAGGGGEIYVGDSHKI